MIILQFNKLLKKKENKVKIKCKQKKQKNNFQREK